MIPKKKYTFEEQVARELTGEAELGRLVEKVLEFTRQGLYVDDNRRMAQEVWESLMTKRRAHEKGHSGD